MPSGGGLLQLVAQGRQDVYLTGNPQVSFFKLVYRRHTNFAIESMPIYFDGDANFGQRATCIIPRRGDLLGPVFLQIQLPAVTNQTTGEPIPYVNSVGHSLIQEITLEIGEQEIDRQTGEWMEIWTQLSTPAGQTDALNNLIGRVDGYIPPDYYGPFTLNVPLQFFFCKNPGSYLPLLALQYHQIRITIKTRTLQELFYDPQLTTQENCDIHVTAAVPLKMMMYGDYVFLDVEERRKFVSVEHEYLIDQVQYTPLVSIPAGVSQFGVRMEFNHPIKELFWYVQRDIMRSRHEYFNFSSLSVLDAITSGLLRGDNMESAVLQLDGQDRFEERGATYFRLIQPFQRHTRTPVDQFIYCYSFALRPEEAQPSGTLNASRIDSMVLQLRLNNNILGTPDANCDGTAAKRGLSTTRVYGLNYNVLRIVDGFGGLLFKN